MKSSTCFNKNGEPLTVYSSMEEAERSALYEKINHNMEFVPYKCKCGGYHLSPKDRQTTCITCSFCIDRDGKSKKLYKTYEDALRRAGFIYKERGIRLNVYPCHYQSGYHLTKG
jgi:hypothetical protein